MSALYDAMTHWVEFECDLENYLPFEFEKYDLACIYRPYSQSPKGLVVICSDCDLHNYLSVWTELTAEEGNKDTACKPSVPHKRISLEQSKEIFEHIFKHGLNPVACQ